MKPLCRAPRSAGTTLPGMMVGLVVGLAAVLGASAAFFSIRAMYALSVDQAMLEERGQRALLILARLIRHSGWQAAPARRLSELPIEGRDDCGQPSASPLSCGRNGLDGSDVLLLRFDGAGTTGNPSVADGTLTDCSGFALPARRDSSSVQAYAAANLIYVERGPDGEPQLMCRYPSRQQNRLASGHTSGALVWGVETMQFRFGLDRDSDGTLDAYYTASEMPDTEAWHQVRVVQIALVLRGHYEHSTGGVAAALTLLPAAAGAREATFMPRSNPGRTRKVFATTVALRNFACRDDTC